MYPVSENYKAAVYAPERTAKARVTFDISDITAAGDVNTINTTAESLISDKNQLINKNREQSYNLATCEPDRFKLDGSFCFADNTVSNDGEIGFVSDNLSGDDSCFAVYPEVTFNFNNDHSSMGLTITFDVLNNEYASDFTVTAYDSNNAIIASVDVTGNTLVQAVPIGQLYNYRKIAVAIKKWSKPYRRARICEVDFGVVRVYQDNNLIKMSLTEDMDLSGSSLPTPEFKFTVDNANREFNILNPQGFYKFLQQRQQVIPEIGIEVTGTTEYIKLGNYLLMEWQSDEGSLTASFTARTILETMSSFDYENQAAKYNYSLYQMAADVFQICGITDYLIDDSLKSIYTLGLVKKTSCRSVLQMIAIAACANVYITRSNTIVIKVSPLSMEDVVDSITMDNMYKEPQIALDNVVKSVNVPYFTDLDNKIDITANNEGVTNGNTLSLEDNTLINTFEQATIVANWILRQKNYRAIFTVNWRGNAAHELNDVIAIENSYGQDKTAIITKNELDYEGYLQGKTEARGLIL